MQDGRPFAKVGYDIVKSVHKNVANMAHLAKSFILKPLTK